MRRNDDYYSYYQNQNQINFCPDPTISPIIPMQCTSFDFNNIPICCQENVRDQEETYPILKTVQIFPSNENSKAAQTDINGNQLPPSSEILGRCWISGNNLKQYFDIINYGPLKEKNGHILNPLVGYLLKTMKDSDSFIAKQNLPCLKYLIIPVSDAKYVNQAGECHWSVLAFCKNSKTFYYFDSLKTHNLEDAKVIKNKLSRVLGTAKDDPIKVCKCPEQKINYECGIHTIITVERLVKDIIANKGINANCLEGLNLDEFDIILKRCFVAYLLQNRQSLSRDKMFSIMFGTFQQNNGENEHKASLKLGIKSTGTLEEQTQFKKIVEDTQLVKGDRITTPQTHNESKEKIKKQMPTTPTTPTIKSNTKRHKK